MVRALLFALAVLIVRADLAVAEPAADQPPKMKFEIDCSDDNQVRKIICESQGGHDMGRLDRTAPRGGP